MYNIESAKSHTHLLLRRKFWITSSSSLLLLIFVLLFAATWYYSSEIQSGAFEVDHSPDEFNLEVGSVNGSSITLLFSDPDDKPDTPGLFGIRSESGEYGHISEIIATVGGDNNGIIRGYESLRGNRLSRGDNVRIERAAYLDDPETAFGISYSEVEYNSPLGTMPAWFVPGSDGERSTWAIMVHGRTSSRQETLRALQIANLAGFPVLSISYRNDEGAPADPSGEYGFGTTEWEDLEAAVEYALAHGADDVILFGFSMGGGLVSHFMIESEFSDRAVGLVFDAPMLNLTSALELAGQQRGLPLWLPWLAANLSSVRFGTDWAALDTRDEMLGLDVPILLFHGTGDETIPVSQSDSFAEAAEAANANVTYVRVEDAEHVGAWNADLDAYRQAMTTWLVDVAGG